MTQMSRPCRRTRKRRPASTWSRIFENDRLASVAESVTSRRKSDSAVMNLILARSRFRVKDLHGYQVQRFTRGESGRGDDPVEPRDVVPEDKQRWTWYRSDETSTKRDAPS